MIVIGIIILFLIIVFLLFAKLVDEQEKSLYPELYKVKKYLRKQKVKFREYGDSIKNGGVLRIYTNGRTSFIDFFLDQLSFSEIKEIVDEKEN